jgi:hypothetical protein
MLENQEGTTPEPTMDELKAKVAYLESSVNIASLSRDSHMNKLTAVREFVQNSIDNEEWTDEELDEIFWTELAELLDLEMMKEVRIDISVSWTATAKVKRGQDVEDLDMSVDEPESSYGFELYNVRETSFDISEA